MNTTAASVGTPHAGLPRPVGAGSGAASLKPWVIAAGIVCYAAAATVLGAYVTSGLLRLAWPVESISQLDPADLPRAWRATAGQPQQRQRVALVALLPMLVFGILIPFGALAATARPRPLHGAARFANPAEVARAGLYGDDGILLGRIGARYLRLAGQQSVLLIAPTRSGNGVVIVIPNLLVWNGSAVVLDIKGENFEVTSGFRAAHGQAVYCWAPFSPHSRTHRWNPLSYIRSDPRHAVGDALAIAQMLYPGGSNASSNESFFADQARNLFLGLVLLLLATPERPRTIGELLRQASGQGRPLHEHLRSVIEQRRSSTQPLPQACVDALNRFLSTSENTLSSILATLNAPLTLFADPLVEAATSADDFDLGQLRREHMTVYLVVPANRLAESAVMLNLFFAQTISQNTDLLPSQDSSLRIPCLLLLDEAAAVGRITVLAKAIGYLAGYNLRVLTVVQSVSQLESAYGREDARTFATNHAAQILFAPREQRDANEYSEMLGTFTQRERSHGRSVSSGARGSSSGRSHNDSSQRRALLLPQEFRELGPDKEVIVMENHKPVFADKIRYHDDPVFRRRLLPPAAVPQVDLDLHLASAENRVRLADPEEAVEPEQIAADFSSLLRLNDRSTPEELRVFAKQLFDRVDELYGEPRSASPESTAAPGSRADDSDADDNYGSQARDEQ